MKLLAIVCALLTLMCGPSVGAEAKIRVVFFTPKDVEPPENIKERMRQVVDYGQAYYTKWLKRWRYEPETVLPVDRDEEGYPVIYFVKGGRTAASGAYDKVGYQGKVRDAAIKQYKLPREGSTWWIFVYGSNLRASRGWGGHADRGGNGYTLLVWNDVDGDISLEDKLCSGAADLLNLKGYLHELAHTMSLPHFGPHEKLDLGMSLMGPNSRTYRRAKKNREERVYITPAVTAIIWKQPQMTGRFDPKPKMPTIEVSDFVAKYDARRNRFLFTGKLTADVAAHSVVGLDLPEKGATDYWRKSYASKLQEDGTFELAADELSPSNGMMKLVFCFENGIFTGTGKGIGFKYAAEIPYVYNRGRYLIPAKAQ